MSAITDGEVQAAIEAMTARGIDSPGELVRFALPDAIIRACERWDTRSNVGPGLLVKWIREGGVPANAPVVSSGRDRPKGLQPGWTKGRTFPVPRFLLDEPQDELSRQAVAEWRKEFGG